MTQTDPQLLSSPAPATLSPPTHSAHPRRDTFLWWLLFSALLWASFLLRWPLIYNFQFCGFYDPGTAIKGVYLLRQGYVPTVDFGYTHGLLSLELTRAWFALAGLTPFAYCLGLIVLEMVIAWGLARLVVALNLTRASRILLALVVPLAIIPNYLTLTHPLEAAFLIHALAQQARGRRQWALALLTACIFVKPSMAYVYGAILVAGMLWSALPLPWHGPWHGRPARVLRRLTALLPQLLPALATGLLATTYLTLRYGPTSVLRTVLARAGAAAYRDPTFGFFFGSGRDFWLPGPAAARDARMVLGPGYPDWLAQAAYYLTSPAGLWLIAVFTTLIAALFAARHLLIRHSSFVIRHSPSARIPELLLTLTLLHTAFLLGFYGWTHAWTYYAYMPLLGLVLLLTWWRPRTWVAAALCLLAATSHSGGIDYLPGLVPSRLDWRDRAPAPETGGLYTWDGLAAEWRHVIALTQHHPTLLLTNGFPAWLPPHMELPSAWFPETGIPTASEIQRVVAQVRQAQAVIIWREYDRLDLWNQPPLAEPKTHFTRIYQGSNFEVWTRSDVVSEPPRPPSPPRL